LGVFKGETSLKLDKVHFLEEVILKQIVGVFLALMLSFSIPLDAFAEPFIKINAPVITNKSNVFIKGLTNNGSRVIVSNGSQNPFDGSFQSLGSVPEAEKYIPQALKYIDGKFVYSGYSTQEMKSMLFILDNDLKVTASFYGPKDAPHISGLAWDGEYLWMAEFDFDRVYKIDFKQAIQDGNCERAIKGSFDTGLRTTSAIEYVNGSLLISDYDNTRKIYLVDPVASLEQQMMKDTGSFLISEGSQGMVWGDGFLYHTVGYHFMDGSETTGHIYLEKLNLSESINRGYAVSVGRYFAPTGVQDIAYDGKHFFTTSETFKNFYKYNRLVEINSQDSYGRIVHQVQLHQGINQVTITSVDDEGKWNSISKWITLDMAKPNLKIQAPLVTNQPFVWVNGWTEAGAAVKVAGRRTVNQRGYFLAQTPLNQGDNQIIVTSTDAAGNVTKITHKVRYQPPPTPDFSVKVTKKKKGRYQLLTISLVNKGTKKATGLVQVKNSKGSVIWQGSASLAPGKTKVFSVKAKSSTGLVQVDPRGAVKELNEKNNSAYY